MSMPCTEGTVLTAYLDEFVSLDQLQALRHILKSPTANFSGLHSASRWAAAVVTCGVLWTQRCAQLGLIGTQWTRFSPTRTSADLAKVMADYTAKMFNPDYMDELFEVGFSHATKMSMNSWCPHTDICRIRSAEQVSLNKQTLLQLPRPAPNTPQRAL